MKSTAEYRKIQGVNPVPSLRKFGDTRRYQSPVIFFDIFVTPVNGGDDHLVFTIRAGDEEQARAVAKRRLNIVGKRDYFDLSTIRARAA